MICTCAGREHLVCRTWKVATTREPWSKAPSLPRYPKPKGWNASGPDPLAWVTREVRKLGAVPSTFAYRPPAAQSVDVADGLACQCKGARHSRRTSA